MQLFLKMNQFSALFCLVVVIGLFVSLSYSMTANSSKLAILK